MLEFVRFIAKEGVSAPIVRSVKAAKDWGTWGRLLVWFVLMGFASKNPVEE